MSLTAFCVVGQSFLFMEFLSHSTEETKKFAAEFINNLSKSRPAGAVIICLSGNLGAGKTTFAQACAKVLGITDRVTSPTFVLIKTYNLQLTTFNKLVHIDAYRLKSGEELEKLGWDEIISDPRNLIFIEWPENVAGIIPSDAVRLKFDFINENTRKISGV